MKADTYEIEGLNLSIAIDDTENKDEEQKDRIYSYLIRAIREYSGMDRKVFCQ